jgi:hypothetical protein
MVRIPKSILSCGAIALAAGLLTLAVPRSAHALAAALVEIANTPASPANMQDISKQAGQLIQLYCPPAANSFSSCTTNISGGPQYVVPANQSLILSTVEFIPQSNGECAVVFLDQGHGTTIRSWNFAGPHNVQFQYPAGIVLPPGAQPALLQSPADLITVMNGYLTSN